MNKFLVLIKKEIKELLTLEMILPLLITIVLFMFVGKIIGQEQDKANETKQNIVLIDNDNTSMSGLVKDTIKQSLNVEENTSGDNVDSILQKAKNENKSLLVVIPSGFQQSVSNLEPNKIEVYSIIKNFSFMGAKNYQVITTSLSAINNALSDQLIKQNTTADPAKIKSPLAINDFVVVGDHKANTNPNEIMGYISTQTTFIPIILFMVIILSSQMIATAIASEKENKTLETLLTTPVKRTYIVISKMAAAGIVALASSGIYIFGFRSYINGISGGAMNTSSSNVSGAINQLGLNFTPENYVILGISLFFGILAALSISLILGAFAQDVKSVAGLTSPLMILVAIPYFLTLFLDISSLSPAVKYLVYAIPFSHSFLAAPNILLGNYMPIIWGILYQFAFFVVFVIIATKIFSTDKIMTMKLNFNKKNRLFRAK